MAVRKSAVADNTAKGDGDAGPVQETILEAALEAFAQRGYDGVSVRELNRQIGVSHNLVHHYFGSKDALWRAAIDHGLTRVNEAWNPEHLNAVDDPVERMKLGLRRFLEVTARSPSVQRIMEHEAAIGGPRLDYIAERYVIPFLSPRLDLYEEATALHRRDLNLASLTLLVASGATAFFSQAALARKIGGPDPFSDEGIEAHVRTMTTILFYGVLGQGPKATDAKGEEP
ncbi:MAG TPA: TetR/AcrR family transcriptional regulator [Alphaproteobacteria bacterium]|jgi:AcrR family transcriptional regulator|nr:TetR/AcrR family transcriptional regulator [Alphaproteobacteria bacterium]